MLLLGNSVDDVQIMTESDPNTDGSADPTPSQLATINSWGEHVYGAISLHCRSL